MQRITAISKLITALTFICAASSNASLPISLSVTSQEVIDFVAKNIELSSVNIAETILRLASIKGNDLLIKPLLEALILNEISVNALKSPVASREDYANMLRNLVIKGENIMPNLEFETLQQFKKILEDVRKYLPTNIGH